MPGTETEMPTPETEMPLLCEMTVGGIVQVEGLKVVVINPAQGVVVPLIDPGIKFLRPSTPVTHYGKANFGTHITWKRFSGSHPTIPGEPE